MRTIPNTQANLLLIFGRYPELNETVLMRDYGTDQGIGVSIEYTRQFNIEEQNTVDFWVNLSPEFWPEV